MNQEPPAKPASREIKFEIVEITVGAGTGFNHPFEQYSNFKPSLTLRARVEGGPDIPLEEAVRQIQQAAHDLVMAEKARILRDIRRDDQISRDTRSLASLRRHLEQQEKDQASLPENLDAFRKKAAEDDAKEKDQMPGWDRDRLDESIADAEKRIAEWPATKAHYHGHIAAYEAHLAALKRGEESETPDFGDDTPF